MTAVLRADRWWMFGLASALVVYVWWSLTGLSAQVAVQGDELVYRAGVRAWLEGASVYQGRLDLESDAGSMYFTYPPLALPVLAVLALLPLAVSAAVLTLASVGALLAWTRIWTRAAWPEAPVWTPLAAALVLLATRPMIDHLHIGQVNVFLLLLATVDLLRPESRRFPRGILLGLAIAVKVTPAALLLLPLLSRQFRTVAIALVTATAGGLIGWLILPREAAFYWLSALRDPGRVGNLRRAENQSLRGLFERFVEGPLGGVGWLVACVLVVALIAWLLRRYLLPRADRLGAVAVTSLLPVLLSPVAWTHHWVWAFPMLAWLAAASGRTAGRRAGLGWCLAGLAVLIAFPSWAFAPERLDPAASSYSPALALLAGGYVYWALGCLGWLAVKARREIEARPGLGEAR